MRTCAFTSINTNVLSPNTNNGPMCPTRTRKPHNNECQKSSVVLKKFVKILESVPRDRICHGHVLAEVANCSEARLAELVAWATAPSGHRTAAYASLTTPVSRLFVTHEYGASNVLADCASRGKFDQLGKLYAQLGMRHERVAVTGAALEFIERALRRLGLDGSERRAQRRRAAGSRRC